MRAAYGEGLIERDNGSSCSFGEREQPGIAPELRRSGSSRRMAAKKRVDAKGFMHQSDAVIAKKPIARLPRFIHAERLRVHSSVGSQQP